MPVSSQTLRQLAGPLSRWRRSFEQNAFCHSTPLETRKVMAEEVLRADPETLRRDFNACSKFDARPILLGLRAPTLIVFGKDDRIVPVLYGDVLRESISGSVMRLIDGAGHMVPLEQPVCLARAMAYFLEDVTP